MSQHRIRVICLFNIVAMLTCAVQAQTSPALPTESAAGESATGETAPQKLDIGILSDPLPLGYKAKAGKKMMGGAEWVLVKVWNPGKRNLSADVFVEKRSMPTHAERFAAAKNYIGGLFTQMKGNGFLPVDGQVPDLARADMRERTLLQLKFEDKDKNAILCGIKIWFDDTAGYCGSVSSSAEGSRQSLLKWLDSLKSKPSEKQTRTWTSLAGQTTEATLKSATLRDATLLLQSGKSVTVPVAQLSKADQDYVKRSPLRTVIYSDTRHPAQTLLPSGFAKAEPFHKSAVSYRHLDGSGMHFQVIELPSEATADLATTLAKIGKVTADKVSTLAETQLPVLTATTPKPINGVVAQYYLTNVEGKLLLVIAEAREEDMPQYRSKFDKVLQTLRTRR